MNDTNTLPISKLRHQAKRAVDQVVATQEPLTILYRSRPKAVLVDVNYFNALEEAVVDMTDAKEAERAKSEETGSLDEYIAKRWVHDDSHNQEG